MRLPWGLSCRAAFQPGAPSPFAHATTLVAADAEAASCPRANVLRVPWLLAASLLVAWLGLWSRLRIDWTINDQYQYGWFVPPLALALLAMRWQDRPAPRPGALFAEPRLMAGLTAAGLLLLLPLRLVEAPNPDWRMIYWVHAGVLAALSLALAGWCGGWRWVRHFAFPVGFLLLAVPWPSGPETFLVQSLQEKVAQIAAEIMNLMAIPAQAQGNLIRVRDQLVGVDEACSGIRSLQTMLMGGFLLGELSRLSWPRRFALLGGGVVMAMVANVFRGSLLVWLAARGGTPLLEKYHDTAGLSVLLIVFAGLLGLNRLLSTPHPGDKQPPAAAPDDAAPVPMPRAVPAWLPVAALAWLACVEIGNAAWYHSGAPVERPGMPRWTVSLPEGAPNFQDLRIDDRTTRMLRYDRAFAARWTRADADAPLSDPADDCTLYFFRWEPGHASAAQASMHQPHICLTASGLTMTADHGVEPLSLPGGVTLPVRRYEFLWHGHAVFVYFVVWQDGVGGQALTGELSARWDRLRAVAERRTNLGRQSLEFIVSGPTGAGDAEALFEREMAAAVRKM